MKPKAELILRNSREERLQSEKAKRERQRINALTSFYEQAANTALNNPDWSLRRTYPLDVDFLAHPKVLELVKEDTETVSREAWEMIKEEIKTWILKYHQRFLQRLVDILDGKTFEGTLRMPDNLKDVSSEPTEAGETNSKGKEKARPSHHDVIGGLMERLSLVTSVFYCTGCDSPHWFPSVIHHVWQLHSDTTTSLRPTKEVENALISRAATDLGLNLSMSTVKELDHEPKYICLRCDERLAPHRSFSQLVCSTLGAGLSISDLRCFQVAHYLKVKTWHRRASAVVNDNPLAAYAKRPRPGGAAVPTLHDDHDWAAEGHLVRADDQDERRQTKEHQHTFIKELQSDRDDDKAGTGGEDFERNYWSRHKKSRCCALCPDGFSPVVCPLPPLGGLFHTDVVV